MLTFNEVCDVKVSLHKLFNTDYPYPDMLTLNKVSDVEVFLRSMSLLTLTIVSPSMLTLNKVCYVEVFLH